MVQQGGKNLEIAVVSKGQKMRMLTLEDIEAHVKVNPKKPRVVRRRPRVVKKPRVL